MNKFVQELEEEINHCEKEQKQNIKLLRDKLNLLKKHIDDATKIVNNDSSIIFNNKDGNELIFKQYLKKLENNNEKLTEDITLEEEITLYEENMRMTNWCKKYLQSIQSETKIIEIN